MTALERWICWLRGHRGAILHFEVDKLSLKCLDCGWESDGWKLTPKRYEPKRAKVVRWRLRRMA